MKHGRILQKEREWNRGFLALRHFFAVSWALKNERWTGETKGGYFEEKRTSEWNT